MPERNIRRHHRIPCTGTLRASWQGTDGVPRYVQGKCLDISEGGLRMESPEPIPVRTIVSISAERLKLSGSATVKYVSRGGSRCIVGLELTAAMLERTLAAVAQAAEDRQPVGM